MQTIRSRKCQIHSLYSYTRSEVNKLPINLGLSSKYWAPEGGQLAISIMRTKKYQKTVKNFSRSRKLVVLFCVPLYVVTVIFKGFTSSSSSSHDCHGVRPLVDLIRSHVYRSVFRGLPRFLLPVRE